MIIPVRSALAVVLIWVVGGCSAFDQDFKAAVQQGPPADSIEGAWEGKWQSQGGHGGGRLRALVTRSGDNIYITQFKAQYAGAFEAESDVMLRVSSTGPLKAGGNADLGYLKGGVYHYEATITPQSFDATYTSESDHGVFNMARPVKR
jgi:hypothetical protein